MKKLMTKKYIKMIYSVCLFMLFSMISYGNTEASGGGTGIFNPVINFVKNLIIDFRLLFIVVGILGIIIVVLAELFMPDMGRMTKVLVSSIVAVAIGLGAEVVVRQIGGSIIDPNLLISNIQYLNEILV